MDEFDIEAQSTSDGLTQRISSDSSNVGVPHSSETGNSFSINAREDMQNRVDALNQRDMIVERILLIANFVVALPPAVFDQLSLVHKPQYALVIMLMSLATMLFSIIDLARKGRRDRVEWMRRDYLPWFYSPGRNYKPLGTFSDIVGLVCGIFQLVFATITYAFLSQHHDNPIKLSVWPIIFAFGVLCSRFPRNPRTRVDSMIVERILLIANFVVELPPAVFDQLSLVHKPQYALVIMLMSLATLLFSIIDLARKGRRYRVEWMMRGYLPWFCSLRRNYKHLVTFSDIVGLVCGIFQLVFATINYAFLSQHYDNPIKLSVWPIIFAFGVLCSRFPRNRVDSISKQNFDPVPILPSRAPILKEIMDSLRDPNINILGVCGMGGVGKTTLVKEVVRQAQLVYLFDYVIFVTVSETPEIRRIQADVAEFLSLRLHEEEIFLRANRLRERLKKEKRILIILDDIWTTLQLEEVGIPFGADCKGCKILLTSRARDVCHGMGAQKVFPLEVLSEEEALNLFEITASVSEEPYLRRIATEIVKESSGLPLAIVKAGRSLRNKRPNVWLDMLRELRTDAEEMEEMVPLVSSLRRQQFARSELSLRGASPTQGTSSMGGETQGT